MGKRTAQNPHYCTIHRDANEAGIILEYERYGATVWRLACTRRKGLPDLWVNPRQGSGFFVEVKSSSGKLLPEQRDFQSHTHVRVVHKAWEVGETLGLNADHLEPTPPNKERAHPLSRKFSIRQRQHCQFDPAIRQWRKQGIQVWVLEKLDFGLPHFWVKLPDAPGLFAHIGSFGSSSHQQHFAAHNYVQKVIFPSKPKATRVRKSSQSGCLVIYVGLFAFLLLFFFYRTMMG